MTMLTIGIDPGLADAPMGCAAVRFDDSTLRLLDTRLLRPARGTGRDWQARCDSLLEQLASWLRIEILPYWPPPILLAYELTHIQANPQTALRLADLGGGVRGITAALEILAIGVQPAASKVALTGHASATKAMMQQAASVLFGGSRSEHEADAIGHALAGQALWHRANVIRAHQ
jgi:Holliday junction resolvasome RuvABC endonuclease subunit